MPSQEPTAASSRGASADYVVLALLAFCFLWNALYYSPYLVDDAFISLRYGWNLAAGEGLAYNPGEPVEGFSNFLWVLIQAAIFALGLPPITTLKLIGVSAGLGTLVASYALARRLFADLPGARLATGMSVGLLAFNTSVAVWSQAGLETVLLAFWIVTMCLRYEIELTQERPRPWSALLFGLAWMTRPEVPIYGLYFVVRRLVDLRARPLGRPDGLWLTAAAAVIVPYEAWGLWYFGQLLPTTHVAKVGESGLESLTNTRMLRQPSLAKFLTRQGVGFPALIALGITGCIVGRRRLPPVLWLVPLCGLVFVVYAKGDWMPRHRFFVPFLPVLCLTIGYGAAALREASRRLAAGPAVVAAILALLAADYTRVQLFAGEPGGWEDRANRDSKLPKQPRGLWFFDVPGQLGYREWPLENSALFLLANVPAGETVVMRDIGFPGFLGMNRIWDTAGLVTPTAARARRDRSDEMAEEMFAELLELRPAFFRLVLPSERSRHINWRIHEWLEGDPRASALYRRVRPRGEIKPSTTLVVYRRKGLVVPSYPERLAEALVRLPEYTRRARERLEDSP